MEIHSQLPLFGHKNGNRPVHPAEKHVNFALSKAIYSCKEGVLYLCHPVFLTKRVFFVDADDFPHFCGLICLFGFYGSSVGIFGEIPDRRPYDIHHCNKLGLASKTGIHKKRCRTIYKIRR